MDIVERAAATGKGIEFVSGHLGNWEVMLHAARQFGLDGGAVYRPVNNPYIDRYIVRQRMAYGPREPIAKGAQGTRRIFTLLRGGKSIFILFDQKTNEGLPIPFFGRDAMTTPAPAALALKLGAIVLFASNERMGGARFRMTVHEPITIEPSGDHDRDVLELTTKLNAALEEVVRKRPSQWLWIPPALAETGRQALHAPRAWNSGFCRRRRARGAGRIKFDLKPVHRPMQVRSVARPVIPTRPITCPRDICWFCRTSNLL